MLFMFAINYRFDGKFRKTKKTHAKKKTCNMLIKVKGYANMKRYTAHLPAEGNLEVPEGATVDDVFRKLEVLPASKMIVIVNGRHKPGDYILHRGDMLTFFPPLEGG